MIYVSVSGSTIFNRSQKATCAPHSLNSALPYGPWSKVGHYIGNRVPFATNQKVKLVDLNKWMCFIQTPQVHCAVGFHRMCPALNKQELPKQRKEFIWRPGGPKSSTLWKEVFLTKPLLLGHTKNINTSPGEGPSLKWFPIPYKKSALLFIFKPRALSKGVLF